MARFILLLAAFAVVVAVADAKETVLLKRYTGGKGCKTLDKITDRWDGKTCAKIKTNYYKIIGKVDKCEDGANYTTRFYNNSGCSGTPMHIDERGLLTFGLGVNNCGQIMPDVFRSYEYCCGDGGCGSANGAMPVRISAATLFITAAVVVVSLL